MIGKLNKANKNIMNGEVIKMKLFKRTISLAIVLMMIISLIPTNIANAAVGDSESNPILYNKTDATNFPEAPNQGYVLLNKGADWVPDEDNVAKVTMSLQGKGVQKKTDVVLVIDRSGSMKDYQTITRTVEKEVEVNKQVPYNEVVLTFQTSTSYEYKKSGSWYTQEGGSISMTAYVDDDGIFRGYKEGTLDFSGLIKPGAGKYRITSGYGFNNWVLNNNNCINALLELFESKNSQQTYNGIYVLFPSASNILKNTQSYKIEKVNEIQYVTENVSISKIQNAREAAKEFVKALLPAGEDEPLNKIAVVSYAGDITVNSQLTSASSSLNTAIDGIVANGGTNIQAGIVKAQEILNESEANNKYIVVLSDGEPTYSFKATEAMEVTSNDIDLNYPGDIRYKLTSFDTSNVKGSGSSYEYYSYDVNLISDSTNSAEFNEWLEDQYDEWYYDRYYYDEYWYNYLYSDWYNYYYNYYDSIYDNVSVKNNGIPTISQALIAKKSGIEMYSVGFDVTDNSNAIYTMQHVASSIDNFYLATDDLSGVFTNIAGKIAKAGTNAKVSNMLGGNIDVGYNFTVIQDASHPVAVTQGSAVVSNDLKLINWDLGTSSTGGDITETPAELTYYIKLNVIAGKTINQDQILNTSSSSSVLYKNYLGSWCKKDFPISVLTAESGTLNVNYYLSDKIGNPINSDGIIIPFKDRVYISDSLNQAVPLGYSVKVSDYAKSIQGYVDQSLIAKNEAGVDTVNSITATRATIYLNFPYYVEPSFSVYYNGNGNTGGTVPSDNNAYKEGSTVNVLGNGSMIKSGYAFKGWSTTNNGAVTYTAGNTFKMSSYGITLYAVWEKSDYLLTINYIHEGGATFHTYTDTLSGEYEVISPVVSGWTTKDLIVSGTMPDGDVTKSVYYKRNQNKLLNNIMYPSKGINPISDAKSSYGIAKDFEYTFGFKFESGQDAPNVNLIFSGDTDKYTLSNFKLYEGNASTPVSTGNTFSSLDKTKIKDGNTYTITYSLKCNELNAGLSIEVNMDYMINNGINPITIKSDKMPDIQ